MTVTDQMTRIDVHTYMLRKNRQQANRNDSRVKRGSTGTYRSRLRNPGAVRSMKRSKSRSKWVTISQQNCDKKEGGAKTPTRHLMASGEGRERGDERVAGESPEAKEAEAEREGEAAESAKGRSWSERASERAAKRRWRWREWKSRRVRSGSFLKP